MPHPAGVTAGPPDWFTLLIIPHQSSPRLGRKEGGWVDKLISVDGILSYQLGPLGRCSETTQFNLKVPQPPL